MRQAACFILLCLHCFDPAYFTLLALYYNCFWAACFFLNPNRAAPSAIKPTPASCIGRELASPVFGRVAAPAHSLILIGGHPLFFPDFSSQTIPANKTRFGSGVSVQLSQWSIFTSPRRTSAKTVLVVQYHPGFDRFRESSGSLS